MRRVHPCARTAPAVRAGIARSTGPTGVPARRHGVGTGTVRRWRRRGTAGGRAIAREVRRKTRFPPDDLTAVIRRFPPHRSRDSTCRILRAEGLARPKDAPPPYPDERPKRAAGRSKAHDPGPGHRDTEPLPEPGAADGVVRRRCPSLAIDRRSRAARRAAGERGRRPEGGAGGVPVHDRPRADRPRRRVRRCSGRRAGSPASGTARPSPPRRGPTAWPRASTAASGARC